MDNLKAQKRCVVADDVRASREQISSWLTKQGFFCARAVDGNEAWNEIQSDPPDLIITDISMPNCCGLELLKRVRHSKLETIRSIPVLVISSLQDGQMTETIRQLGGNALLAKPLDKQSTLSIVLGLMARGDKSNLFIVKDSEESDACHGLVSPTFRRHMQNESNWE